MALEIQQKNDNWIFIVPVFGVDLTKVINNEIKICQVTFICMEKLVRTRKRFGIPNKISDYRTDFFQQKFSTVAILRQNGKIEDIRVRLYKIIEEELYIFLSSFFGFTKRNYFHSAGVLGNGKFTYFEDIFLSSTTQNVLNCNTKAVNQMPLTTCRYWKNYQKKYHFFDNLLKIINSKSNKFKELKRIAFLIGKSFNSNDIVDSFLYNMIIIETLLTIRNDKQKEALIERLNSFFDWLTNWDNDIDNKIEGLYKKRSAYVHNLEYNQITITDLLFTDELIFNLLFNIVKHPKEFSSKEMLINFSKKIEAEKILGIKESKVRPKTFSYISKKYDEKDYKVL